MSMVAVSCCKVLQQNGDSRRYPMLLFSISVVRLGQKINFLLRLLGSFYSIFICSSWVRFLLWWFEVIFCIDNLQPWFVHNLSSVRKLPYLPNVYVDTAPWQIFPASRFHMSILNLGIRSLGDIREHWVLFVVWFLLRPVYDIWCRFLTNRNKDTTCKFNVLHPYLDNSWYTVIAETTVTLVGDFEWWNFSGP